MDWFYSNPDDDRQLGFLDVIIQGEGSVEKKGSLYVYVWYTLLDKMYVTITAWEGVMEIGFI